MYIPLCLILSYFLGAIPFSLIVSKLFYHIDIRKYGSGNAGGTNTGRVLGKLPGFIVMVLDQLKAVIAVVITTLIMNHTNPELTLLAIYLTGIFTVLGHCYSIFNHFKGGKAVACTFGFVFVTNIYLYIITLTIYVILLKLTKFVSFGSITVFFLTGALAFIPFFRQSPFLQLTFDIYYPILILLLAVYIVIKHRSNIKRLKDGNENKIKWMK